MFKLDKREDFIPKPNGDEDYPLVPYEDQITILQEITRAKDVKDIHPVIIKF